MTSDIKAIEQAVSNLSQTETPFMILFFLIMIFVIFMSIKVMKYVSGVSDSHNKQITTMTANMKEQREEHFKMVIEERNRSDRRESELFKNLEKNTKQLEGIAGTLEKVQSNYVSLENKLTTNFNYLEYEIETLKEKITEKTKSREN